MTISLQDRIPGHCFGCGSLNTEGLQIKSFWVGDEAVCAWRAQPKHIGHPGILYGGVIASVVDCHCIWTAMAYAHRQAGEEVGSSSAHKFVTAALSLQYRKPVRIEDALELRARVIDFGERKAVVRCTGHSANLLVVEAEVVVVRMPHVGRATRGYGSGCDVNMLCTPVGTESFTKRLCYQQAEPSSPFN